MGANQILIAGAREHNLKDISLALPRDRFIVITGLSGSGKSSLAFDTIYAEGQRRYVESLSSYARQFLGQMNKPDVDSIEGLSPAISIDQKTTSRNPRSTVGTVTEIYDYLRLLYARIGHPHCWICGRAIEGQSKEQIVDQILGLEAGTRFVIKAPVVRGQKGWHREVIEHIRQEGFNRVEIDGSSYALDESLPELDKNVRHDLSIVVDRLVMKEAIRRRLTDSVETALSEAGGLLLVDVYENGGALSTSLLFSENLACPEHGVSLPEMAPRIFSFNSPHGACETCGGSGCPPGDRSRPGCGRSPTFHSRGSPAALEWQFLTVLRPDREGRRRPVRDRRGHALGGSAPGGARRVPSWHPRGTPLRVVRESSGRDAQLHDHFRRHRAQPGEALPGDGLRLHPRQDRGVHGRASVPGLSRSPTQASFPGRDSASGLNIHELSLLPVTGTVRFLEDAGPVAS